MMMVENLANASPTDSCHFMKTLYTLLLIAANFSAIAQSSSINKHITNDGHQLRIRVDIEDIDRSIHYSRSFDVSDMAKTAIKALENRIVDSLVQRSAELNAEVSADLKLSRKTREKQTGYGVGVNEEIDTDEDSLLEATTTVALPTGDGLPSSVLVREDKENGRLWIQYTFQNDGDELVIERTANVVGKSDREKQAIIRDTERRFGIEIGNQ